MGWYKTYFLPQLLNTVTISAPLELKNVITKQVSKQISQKPQTAT